jgi:hypothetical protein
MKTALYQWLADAEDKLIRMIVGIFHFLLFKLPEVIYRLLVDTVGPLVARMIRVSCLFVAWLTLMFGPAALAVGLRLSLRWDIAALVWASLSVGGSVWGLYRAVKVATPLQVVPQMKTAVMNVLRITAGRFVGLRLRNAQGAE